MAKVYVADDEKNIRDLLATFLQAQGLEVETFETGDQLLLAFMKAPCDVVVLDVMMPGTDGFGTAESLRQLSDVPLILLTARSSDQDMIDGFAAGVDDYFTKPFSPLQLALRIKAIVARQENAPASAREKEPALSYDGLELSSASRSALYQEKEIKLTKIEYDLLKLLLEAAGQAISREDLLNQVWGYEADVETRAVDDAIKRLRQKLRKEECHVLIETVWGYGFKLAKKTQE